MITVTVKAIEKILKEYPTLHYFGFGLPEDQRKLIKKEITPEQFNLKLDQGRQQLLKSIDQINYVVLWLRDVEKIKSINRKRTSYGCKEMPEKTVPGGYISNGCFIVGAILAGFQMEIQGQNAAFNMSEKSLNKIESQRWRHPLKF